MNKNNVVNFDNIDKIDKIVGICKRISIILIMWLSYDKGNEYIKGTIEIMNLKTKTTSELINIYKKEIEKNMEDIRETDKKIGEQSYKNDFQYAIYSEIRKNKEKDIERINNLIVETLRIEKGAIL